MAWPQPLPEVLSLRCASAATSQLGLLALVAPPGGLEPPTVCLEGSCSIPLSYGGLLGAGTPASVGDRAPRSREDMRCHLTGNRRRDPQSLGRSVSWSSGSR